MAKRWNFYTAKELKPSGWLLRQLEIQAEGLSGNLHKIWPDIRDSAWIGGNREGWERVPYWLDGFIPLAYLLEREDMIATVQKYIDAILDAQKEDGWICPCADDERATYDTWAVQLISKVLLVYYECSGDHRIPQVIYRVLKNYYDLLKNGTVALFAWGKFRWYEACIAIDFAYETFREDWLKELAEILKAQGANYNDFTEIWKVPLNWWRQETHIVNLAMMLKSEAVSCDLLGEAYADNAEYLRSVLDQYNGTVYESFTGDECLAGISPNHGTELCAIVEQMYTYELLYAYTGDAKWAERLEVLAFNALPATITADMWTHQYVQLSNQIACQKFPGKAPFATNGPEAHLFGLEPHYGCCTANFNQGWPKFALSAFLRRDDQVLSAFMIPSELRDSKKYIKLETNYPFENRAVYTVKAEEDFTLQIRIPSFAQNVCVNGQKQTGELSFSIAKGETREIAVTFDVAPRFQERPNALYAVQCGSLLFSVPIQYEKRMYEYENDGVIRKYPYCDYEFVPTSAWNYAFAGRELTAEYRGLDELPFSNEKPAMVVKAKVCKIDWGMEEGYAALCAKLPKSAAPISPEEEIELYPYGCAKLRMTEMPFAK